MLLHLFLTTLQIFIRKQITIMIDEDYIKMMCPYKIYKVGGKYLQYWIDTGETVDITETEEIQRAVLCASI